MKFAYFMSVTGQSIAIPVAKITGFTTVKGGHGNTFIATGADDPDGGENGWYVDESYLEVNGILEATTL